MRNSKRDDSMTYRPFVDPHTSFKTQISGALSVQHRVSLSICKLPRSPVAQRRTHNIVASYDFSNSSCETDASSFKSDEFNAKISGS